MPYTGVSTLMSATIKNPWPRNFILFDFGPDDPPSHVVSFRFTCDGGQAEVDRLCDGLPGEAASS